MRDRKSSWIINTVFLTVCFTLLCLQGIGMIGLCPFSKVEESFNTQGLADFLRFFAAQNDEVSRLLPRYEEIQSFFDHHHHPGVVPRTFLGSFTLAYLLRWCKPVLSLLQHFLVSSPHRITSFLARVGTVSTTAYGDVEDMVLGRVLLGIGFWGGCVAVLCSLQNIQKHIFGNSDYSSSLFFVLYLLSQFHLPFYSSRLLPNSFGLVLSTFSFAAHLQSLTLPFGSLSIAQWIWTNYDDNDQRKDSDTTPGSISISSLLSIVFLTVASLVFRCDLIPLLFSLLFDLLVVRGVPGRCIHLLTFALTSLFSLLLSISVDSWMWQHSAFAAAFPNGFLWPEGAVFFFNAIQKKSYLWGTNPWHWYVTNAIPRALGLPLLFLVALPGVFYFVKRLPSETSSVRSRLLAIIVCCSAAGTWVVPPIATLSYMGHKEMRFIFPSLLALTAFVSLCFSFYTSIFPKYRCRLLWPLAFIFFGINGAISAIRLISSIGNYSAAYALQDFYKTVIPHPLERTVERCKFPESLSFLGSLLVVEDADSGVLFPHTKDIRSPDLCEIHLSVASSEMGISKFLHHDEICRVDKTEGLHEKELVRFSYLIDERPQVAGFRPIRCYAGFHKWRRDLFRPVLVMRPFFFLHERRETEHY